MKVLIVGGGIAAAYAANQLKKIDPSLTVEILSKEPYRPYDRIHLCPLISGAATLDDITLELDSSVILTLNSEVVALHPATKEVEIRGGERVGYDYLLIATGSNPKAPMDISGIVNAATLRSADDSYKIARYLEGGDFVVVGTGPLGLEAVEILAHVPSVQRVTVLSRSNSLYAREIDLNARKILEEILGETGKVRFSFEDEIVDHEIKDGQIIRLTTRKLTIDNPFVLFATGIEPNIPFAKKALRCEKGILTDEAMQTSDPYIWAIGECAQLPDGFIAGHVKDCTMQADVAINNLLMRYLKTMPPDKRRYYEANHTLKLEPLTFKKSVNIDALKVGTFDFVDLSVPGYRYSDEVESIVLSSKAEKRLDQFLIKDEKIVRFIGINSNIDIGALAEIMASATPVDAAWIYQNRKISERGRMLCSCTGTYEEDLRELCIDNCITSFDELKHFSQAGRVCGRCRRAVADFIAKIDITSCGAIARPRKKTKAEIELEEKRALIQKRIDKYNRLHPKNPITADNLEAAMKSFDISSRDYNNWIASITQKMHLHRSLAPEVGQAVQSLAKIPIIWLELADCSGNSEAFIKSMRPSVEDLIFDYVSIDYHELLMSAAGDQSESVLERLLEREAGKFVLIVEGAIPLAMDGKYLRLGPKGETGIDLLKRCAQKAALILAVGSCALDGGVVAAYPNPTGAVGVAQALGRNDVINLPGCPANPINIVGTLLHYIMFEELPELDELNRPKWAYGAIIHDMCERRGRFDNEEFVLQWGDAGAKQSFCLFKMGCKGPYSHANCSTVKFNEGTSWPVQAGHGCIGCVEPGFIDKYCHERMIGPKA
ncbi:MAG: hydrogenase small subunit [Campylobacterales bacterium]